MNIETINISTSDSPDLAMLSGRVYQKDYTSLPNENLPKSLFNQLNDVYVELTGKDLVPSENSFIIKAVEGVYSRLFGPILKALPKPEDGEAPANNFVIQWGPNLIPVVIEKNKIFVIKDGEKHQIDAEFGEYNFSGRGEDACLSVTIERGNDDFLTLPVAIRFVDWDNKLTAKELSTYLKKSPEKLETTILAYKPMESSRPESIDVDLRELPMDVVYNVTGYYACKVSYGTNFRIYIDNVPDHPGKLCCAWICPSIRSLLQASPVIDEENPAKLTILSRRVLDNGNVSVKAALVLSEQPVSETGGLNLKFA